MIVTLDEGVLLVDTASSSSSARAPKARPTIRITPIEPRDPNANLRCIATGLRGLEAKLAAVQQNIAELSAHARRSRGFSATPAAATTAAATTTAGSTSAASRAVAQKTQIGRAHV